MSGRDRPLLVVCRRTLPRVDVDNLLGATANPENPNEVDGLFLGGVLVGAVGVANIMIISVLERRSEIGLRLSLGVAKGHIRV